MLQRPKNSQPSTPINSTHHGLRLVLKHGVNIPDDELNDLCVVLNAKPLFLQVTQVGAQQHLVVGRQALDVRFLLSHLLQGVLPEKGLTQLQRQAKFVALLYTTDRPKFLS